MNNNKSFSHKELAGLYFPASQPKSASVQFTRWITRDEELLEELREAGYTKKQRIFSPLQVEILFNHFGEPQDFHSGD